MKTRRQRRILSAAILVAATGGSALAATNTVSFQNGVGDYTGTVDLRVSSTLSRQWLGTEHPYYFVDGFSVDDPSTPAIEPTSPDEQALVRFDNIFGSGPGQVPVGAYIISAQLTMTTPADPAVDPGGVANANAPRGAGVSRLLQSFTPGTTTYLDFGAEGPSYSVGGTTTRTVDTFQNRTTGRIAYGDVLSTNVAPIVQAWSGGAANEGFAIQYQRPPLTTDGWAMRSTSWTVPEERPKLSVTYTTDPVATVSFKQGVNGYTGSTMQYVRQDMNYGTGTNDGAAISQASVDGPNDVGTSFDDQAMLKFDNLFGSGPGQIPANAQILKASLVLRTGTSGSAQSNGTYDVRPMNVDWDVVSVDGTKPTLYTDFGGGTGPTAAAGVVGAPVASIPLIAQDSEAWFDLTPLVKGWQSGQPNYGVDIQAGLNLTNGVVNSDAWQIYFNGASDEAVRPELVITFALAAGLVGDVNGDGLVNGQDINPFVYALLNGETAFAAQYPTGQYGNADVNSDSLVNGQDINPFVAKLLGGGLTAAEVQASALSAVPEPGSLAWVGACAAALLGRRRRV